MTDFVVIGTPGDRRVALFNAALGRLGLAPARLVGYADLLDGRADVPSVVGEGAVVRVESPGKDEALQRRIAEHGNNLCGDVPLRASERGEIIPWKYWYLGYRDLLDDVQRQLSTGASYTLMNAPDEILTMFDKRATHARLEARGVPVPRAHDLRKNLGGDNFVHALQLANAVKARLQVDGLQRVIVKPVHGSSASGLMTYEVHNQQVRATSTVEMHQTTLEDGGLMLRYFNSRRLHRYEGVAADELLRFIQYHGAHIEQWIPKASIDGYTFDLRVVVIAGEPRHIVVRKSKGPFTNLHLLNEREGPARVRAKMGDDAWEAAMQTCRDVAACFANSLYMGVDLLIATGFRRHYVAEVNAFGDLLPGTVDARGMDTYEAEIRAVLA